MVASKHWTETHSFEWWHCLVQTLQSHQRFIKKWKHFLIKCPKILRRETFLFSLRGNFTYFLKYFLLKKKSVKLNRFLCKDKSSQNFLRSLVKLECLVFKFPDWQNFKVSWWHNFTKKSKPTLWCFGVSNCFVIGENLRKQAQSENFNAAHSRKRKSNSRFLKPGK